MSTLSFDLPSLIAFGDPTYLPHHDLRSGSGSVTPGTTHFMGLVPVTSLPDEMPTSPNLRRPNLRSAVAKTMMQSLLSNDGDFHLKNKGITLLASSVDAIGRDRYIVSMDTASGPDGDGILDGGHTYATIRTAITEGAELDKQYVFVWIRVNVPSLLKASIAEALNNTANVSVASLANRRDEFGWLKNILGPEVSSCIAWQQNETGKQAKVEELIAQLYAVNAHFIDSSREAYASRSKTLSAFRRQPEAFTSHAGGALDTLRMYEYIQLCFADRVRVLLGDRSVDRRASMFYPIYDPSIEQKQFRTSRSVSLVMLGGLLAFLRSTGEQAYGFDRPLTEIVEMYNAAWPEISRVMKQSWDSADVGGDPGAFGKRVESWATVLDVLQSKVDATPVPTSASTGSLSTYDAFEAIGLSPAELESFWLEDREEMQRDLDEIRATLLDQREELSQQALHELLSEADRKAQRIAGINTAIAALTRPHFGLCRSCNQRVELSRLYEPLYALSCVNC